MPSYNIRRLSPPACAGSGLLAALLLAACSSGAEKAVQFDTLADQMMAVQAYPAAAQALQRGIKLDANNADRWVKMGRAERMMNSDGLAATAYQRAVDLAPDNVEALQALSVLLVRGGQYDLAKQYVTTLMVLSPNDIGGLLAQGAIALRERRLIDGDRIAEQLITLAPSLSDGFILKARVMEERGEPARAADYLAKRLVLDSNNTDLATQVLRLSRKAGLRERVRDVALTLARLLPDDPRYQLEAARTLAARGKATEADAILARLRTRYLANPQVMLGLAHLWIDRDGAAAATPRLVALAGDAPGRSKAMLATLLVRLGHAAQAEAVLAPALGGAIGNGSVDAHAAHSGALLALGRTADARAEADRVLAFDGRNSDSLLVRAKIEGAARNFRPALDDAQLVMSEDPQNSEAALLVARLWARQGNAVLADKAFGTAQEMFPDDLVIHRERIAWLVSQGRARDAASLATSFANQHTGLVDAARLMAATCQAADDALCAADARQRLGGGRA